MKGIDADYILAIFLKLEERRELMHVVGEAFATGCDDFSRFVEEF